MVTTNTKEEIFDITKEETGLSKKGNPIIYIGGQKYHLLFLYSGQNNKENNRFAIKNIEFWG